MTIQTRDAHILPATTLYQALTGSMDNLPNRGTGYPTPMLEVEAVPPDKSGIY
jgi:hypothetical protein